MQIVGGGTGMQIVGGGTGLQIVGGGTGTQIVGGGTGTQIVGGGTGSQIVGGGTGSRTLIVGGGTGTDAIAITLPNDESLQMEISLSCDTATVYVLDSAGYEVVTFENVKFKGDSGLCGNAGSLAPSYSLPVREYGVGGGEGRSVNRKN
jgi:Ca2+-binding RTX toxin-like protein